MGDLNSLARLKAHLQDDVSRQVHPPALRPQNVVVHSQRRDTRHHRNSKQVATSYSSGVSHEKKGGVVDELTDESGVFEEGGFGGFEGGGGEGRASEGGEEALEEGDGEEGRRGEEEDGEGFVLEPSWERRRRRQSASPKRSIDVEETRVAARHVEGVEGRGSPSETKSAYTYQVIVLPITSEVTAAAALAPTIAARKDPPTPIAPAK